MRDRTLARFRARFAGSVAIVALSARVAFAQNVDISIPAQSLAMSLRAVAQQTGENILFTPDAVSGLNGAALSGPMTAEQAVSRLIQGTGLEVISDGKGGLIVRPLQQGALIAPVPANLQPQPPVETVVVSGSRIQLQGYAPPTPDTAIGAEQLDRDAKIDIGDAIRELPQVSGGSANTANNGGHGVQGDAGVDTINLRNLGDIRTLTLFDGQRVVSSSPAGGGADLATLPMSLIQRVEVVTGGASAAWGSDAMAGVVNLVLDKTFSGLKTNVEFSDTGTGDHRQGKAELSYGTDFLADRGHAIISGSYTMSPDTVFNEQRSWWNPITLIGDPVAGPTYIHRGNFGSANFTQGGLITASAAGAAGPSVTSVAPANALIGIQFVGSGTPVPFSFGTLPVTNGNCFDCSANKFTGSGAFGLIAAANHNGTLFGYASYKVTDNITASGQIDFGHSYEESVASARTSSLTITANNAYLDPAIAAQMAAGGIPNSTLGTNNNNNMDVHNPTFLALENSLSTPVVLNTRDLSRGVFTLEGTLGDNWAWNAYIQHSQVRISQYNPNNSLTANYNNAVNAVRVATTNVGSSGLPIGTIACTSTLTAPTNGCQPLDVFGFGVASRAALNYIEPGLTNKAIEDQGKFNLNQDVASGSIQGTLPWEMPAGKIAIAAGAEYRLEQQTDKSDPAGLGDLGAWQASNYNHFQAHYDVTEGFGEVTVPILRGNIVQSFDLNAAGRITSYSTSGLVETWKLGLISQVNDVFKLRGTYSTDIRAPAIAELFLPPLMRTANQTDPRSGNLVSAPTISVGNPALLPEVANTVSGGVVFTPTFVDGLSVSMDWFAINIHDAIFTPSTAQVLAQCAAGVAYFCQQEVFSGPANTTGLPTGLGLPALSAVYNRPLNAASETTSGLDFEADYHVSLFDGVLNAHAVGAYNDEHTRTAVGATNDCAGQLGGDAPCTANSKFRMNLATGYAQGPWQVSLQARYFGSARLVNAWVSGINVDNNAVPAVAYLDLRTSYKWSSGLQFYANGNNLTDAPPPNVPSTTGGSGTNGQYDQLGRSFNVGVRIKY